MRYAVVIAKAGDNYSAYVPDLPGCIATSATVTETEAEIRDAIRFTSKDCARMVGLSPHRSAAPDTSTPDGGTKHPSPSSS